MKFIIFVLLFLPSLVFAQAQVFPTHITLTEETPSSYLNLRNTSNEKQTYKIDLVHFSMAKDGSMSRDTNKENELSSVIKFSPKTIELAPGDKQVVRVMATSFDELNDGEHYIHIHFTPSGGNKDESKTGHSMSLKARIAVAVPIVVRKGTGAFAGKLEKFKAEIDPDKNLIVSFNMKNDNKFYLYGDLDIIGNGEKGDVIFDRVIGLASYIPERSFSKVIPQKDWSEKLGSDVPKKIKVVFKSNTESVATFEQSADAEVAKVSAVAPKKPVKKKSSKRP